MKRIALAAVVVLLAPAFPALGDESGWDYLMNKLVADGVERDRVAAAFGDPRVAPFSGLEFSAVPPAERRTLYRRFSRPAAVAAARRCRLRYAPAFELAERTQGVPANLLAAILFIESGCGGNTGSDVAFYRLARLAMANAPENLQANLDRYTDEDGVLDPQTAAQLQARARYLEHTFYPEVRALFVVAQRMGVDPLDIRGSGAGAFGAPQFLPTSYLQYGVDADGDGRVSLDETADAAASCARFFVAHGWRPGLSNAQRRAVVWQYNRSSAYVDAVLGLAGRIGSASKSLARRAPAKRSRKPHSHPHRLHRA